MNAILAWILSTFLFLSPAIFAQPTTAPDTRTSPYADGVAPDKYGVWPTEDFETGQAPLWLQTWLLQPAYNLRGLLAFGSQNDSIVALYKGKIVYEWYADGWDQDTQHTINSATKSVTSALVGIAIAEGYINSIEDKVVDYFPDLDILIDKERKEQITIAQLLTMTSGFTGIIDPDELTDLFARSDLEERADEIIARFEADTTKFYFECASLVGDPGAYWNYSPISTDILAGLVAHAVGKPLLEYAEEKLFAPMGITNYSWLTDVDGTVHGAGGLFMTPRDMAKFGYLYLNYGRWEEQQLVPADWVAQSGPDSKLPFAYGHLFWNTPLVPFVGAYEAYGITGQLIDIFPGQDLVIVRTGSGTALENWIVGGILGG